MNAPKILEATEISYPLNGEPFTYTFHGNTNVLAKCVDLTVESYQRRSLKLGSRMEYHTIDATREVVTLFDNRGNIWAALEITHTVNFARTCSHCGDAGAIRVVKGHDDASPQGDTTCRSCLGDFMLSHITSWWLPRAQFNTEERTLY